MICLYNATSSSDFAFKEEKNGIFCFALIGCAAKSVMLPMVRFWLKKFKESPKRKVCTVKKDFYQGRHLMEILRFKPKRILKQFFNGSDYLEFERIE